MQSCNTIQTIRTINYSVCPFAAEPLILNNGYAFCRPSSIGDCPVDYLCDQSSVLGRSICCRDQGKPNIAPNRPAGLLHPHINVYLKTLSYDYYSVPRESDLVIQLEYSDSSTWRHMETGWTSINDEEDSLVHQGQN